MPHSLLSFGPFQSSDGVPLLVKAAEDGLEEFVDHFLHAGANPNSKHLVYNILLSISLSMTMLLISVNRVSSPSYMPVVSSITLCLYCLCLQLLFVVGTSLFS